ncbi:DUF4405 domain-containing protein [Brevibacillus sp. SYSU BS000544]|uniref:DUF4405 domain-containing protein n=1 Tax=Brevibacillus sp. SYSU BS000544 TaxID=3416443 RepID=UPI003CE521F4
MEKNRWKFWFDIVLAILFGLLFTPEVTSLAFHEIAGLVWGAAILGHICVNKDWVIGISKKIFDKKIKGKTKFSSILTLVLFMDMVIIMISGLFISKVVFSELRYSIGINWKALHIVSSLLGLVIVGIHIGMHWNWIKQMGSQFPKLAKLFTFQRPSRKVVSRIILVIGTIALIAQMPKMILLTPGIFSEQAVGQEEFHHVESKENGQNIVSTERQESRESGEISNREGRGHKKPFSPIQLVGIIPILLIYLAMFAAIAFYTYIWERRSTNKRKNASSLDWARRF